jgi:hypothetical protein
MDGFRSEMRDDEYANVGDLRSYITARCNALINISRHQIPQILQISDGSSITAGPFETWRHDVGTPSMKQTYNAGKRRLSPKHIFKME